MRGRLCWLRLSSSFTPQKEITTPSAPAASTSNKFSVMNCRASRKRVAPSAVRTAKSRCRVVAWASNRLATLTHATTNKNPTATKIIISGLRTFPTMYSCCGMSVKSTPSMSLPFSCLSCLPIALTSARACSSETFGSRRAMTLQLCAEREISAGNISRGTQTSALCGKPMPCGITPTTLTFLSIKRKFVFDKSGFAPSSRCQKP